MKKMVVIGGSAGALEALLQIVPRLRPDLGMPIILVLHRKVAQDTILTDLLSAKTPLAVKEIEEKEKPLPGSIYIVPADYHLLIEKDHSFTLDYSERVNYSRPSIDVVFESAAHVYGPELTCILLSGANADGTEGLKYVKKMGGLTIAQLPATAEVAYMPEQAIAAGTVDHIWSPVDIAAFLNQEA